MSTKVITSFSLTPDNAAFIKQQSNMSAFLNQLLSQYRNHTEKQSLLKAYNHMSQDTEMNDWLCIANHDENIAA